MISLGDRTTLALGIHTAHAAGARLHLACEIVGIDLRTLQRWAAPATNTTKCARREHAEPFT